MTSIAETVMADGFIRCVVVMRKLNINLSIDDQNFSVRNILDEMNKVVLIVFFCLGAAYAISERDLKAKLLTEDDFEEEIDSGVSFVM